MNSNLEIGNWIKPRTTRLLAVLIAAGLLACGSACAGDFTNAPVSVPSTNAAHSVRMRHVSVEWFARTFDLTAGQKALVKPILNSQWQRIYETLQQMRNKTLSPQEGMARIRAIHDQAAMKLKSVLTPEQFAKWEKMTGFKQSSPGTNGPPAPGQ